MRLIQLVEKVNPARLYLPLGLDGHEIRAAVQEDLWVGNNVILPRQSPRSPLVLVLDQAAIEKQFDLEPVRGGEHLPFGVLRQLHQYVLAIELNGEPTHYLGRVRGSHQTLLDLLSHWAVRHQIPMQARDPNVKVMLRVWTDNTARRLKREEEYYSELASKYPEPPRPPRPQYATPKTALERFAMLPKAHQEYLVTRLFTISGWLEGWQMESHDNREAAFLMKLLQFVLDHEKARQLDFIYRSAWMRQAPEDFEDQRIVITSPKRFQSWTTSEDLAIRIGYNNIDMAHGRYLIVWKAVAKDLDVVLYIRDLRRFIEDLTHKGERYAPEVKIPYDQLHAVQENIHSFAWQDEVVVRSPVNRRIPVMSQQVVNRDD